jgi:hypothetical protein
MTRLEKLEMAIELGYTYNPETGKVYGVYGKEITAKDKDGYITINSTKVKNLVIHQFAWYLINKEIVEQLDHINGVRDDNRICNLRSVTSQQNNWNRKKAKGYSWYKNYNKWVAQIMVNGKNIHLGYFHNEEEAKEAYLNAKQKYHVI